MKIVFSVKNGRITATNSNVFKSFFVPEVTNVSKWLYAVIDEKPVRVIVVSSDSKSVQLMFEQDDNTMKRMYIEDGDVLYTTKDDAEIAIKKSQLKRNVNEIADKISKQSKETVENINKKFNEVDWNGMFKSFQTTADEMFCDMQKQFDELVKSFEKKVERKNDSESFTEENSSEPKSDTECVSVNDESVEDKKKRLLSERMSLLARIKNINKEIFGLE